MLVDILGTWFSIALHPRKPAGSLGQTAQDGHLNSHTTPELCKQEDSCTSSRHWQAAALKVSSSRAENNRDCLTGNSYWRHPWSNCMEWCPLKFTLKFQPGTILIAKMLCVVISLSRMDSSCGITGKILWWNEFMSTQRKRNDFCLKQWGLSHYLLLF